jgi:hypothetical protein
MWSEAKTTANRRNAQKSTGPRTLEGKTIVAQNAIDHGLPARISGGHSPPYPSETSSAKQSQSPVARPAVLPSPVETQYLASPSPGPKMQPPTANPCPAEPAPAACETKPAGAMTACTETQDVASLHYDKQSQSAGQALVSCETKPTGQACEGFRDGAAACSLRVALSQPWAPALRVRRRLAAMSRGAPSIVRKMVDAVRKVVYPRRDGPV